MSRVAIIGSGVSGAVAARLLCQTHDVTLFESAAHAGGHARTVPVDLEGRVYWVDTGFMVFNQRTYPNFCRLLDRLGVASRESDMSFSVQCGRSGLEYQGSSLNGLFTQRRNLVSPRFWRLLRDIGRFNREATKAVGRGAIDERLSVVEWLSQHGLAEPFTSSYLAPMAAAIWSSDPRSISEFPAHFLLGFFANHGLLQITDRPQWRTVTGGARRYVQAVLQPLADRVRLNTPVASIVRTESEVLIAAQGRPPESFEQVVLACHADQALKLLHAPTDAELQVLSSFPYQPNEAVLHTDVTLLPRRPRAWASWNYHSPVTEQGPVSVTYNLSRLQGHATRTPLLQTLNACRPISPGCVLERHTFRHPAYSAASIAAQRRWEEISGQNRTHYCGAYWGYGFHEDGVVSALRVAESLGAKGELCKAACTKAPSPTADARR